ncbi:hypothetical protein [Ottowia sp.]|uniref:hypothetical protein n=1 Tax=Ottowia sp. TaxID=1898956 RepID=UPI0039E602BB
MTLGLSSLYALGLPLHDAEHLGAVLDLLLYLVVFFCGPSSRAARGACGRCWPAAGR